MELNELKQKVSILDVASNYNYTRVGAGKYRINPCPVCGHKDHFTLFADTNSYSSFSSCCKGGSVLDFLIEVERMTMHEAIDALHEMAGAERGDYVQKTKKASPGATGNAKGKDKKLTDTILQWHAETSKNEKYKKALQKVMTERFINPQLVVEHKISVVNMDGLRAVFPVWHNGEVVSYTARALEGQKLKYKKPSGVAASAFYFNMDLLNEKLDAPIILTEGAVDALNLELLGFNAIALDSTKNINAFKEYVQSSPLAKDKVFLTAFDNDAAGHEATEIAGYPRITIPNEYNDINEWLIDSVKQAKQASTDVLSIKVDIRKQMEYSKQPDNVMAYLEHGFAKDIEELASYRQIKTGFANLDNEMTGLYPGLYVVGGISSVGKTTFVHQLGDQVAAQGEHVIYFSLEQSRLEMVSKSLSRETAKNDLNGAITSFSIRQGKTSEQLEKAKRTYANVAQRVNIVEGNFNTTVEAMKSYVEQYAKQNNVKPFVIVDYLQIIPAPGNMNDKQRTDYNVTELKRMSRDFNIPVIVISSLNRGNYLAPIDFEAFKESGAIEYSADVIWGLQLEVIRDELFNKEGKLKEKREKVAEAKAEPIRQIELACLKNRNGTPVFNCSFTYYARHDFYEPNKHAQPLKSSRVSNTRL